MPFRSSSPRFPVFHELLPRTTLMACLQAQVREGPTWVRAPEGYGKTSLLAQLAAAWDARVVWITCKPHHEPVTALMAQLLDGLELASGMVPLPAVPPRFGLEVSALLDGVSAALCSRPDHFTRGALFVIDDVQHLAGTAAVPLFAGLVGVLKDAGAVLVVAGQIGPGDFAGMIDPTWHWRLIEEAALAIGDQDGKELAVSGLAEPWVRTLGRSPLGRSLLTCVPDKDLFNVDVPCSPSDAMDRLLSLIVDALPTSVAEDVEHLAREEDFDSSALVPLSTPCATDETLNTWYTARLIHRGVNGRMTFAPSLRRHLLSGALRSGNQTSAQCSVKHAPSGAEDLLEWAPFAWANGAHWHWLSRAWASKEGPDEPSNTHSNAWSRYWEALMLHEDHPDRSRAMLVNVQDRFDAMGERRGCLLSLAAQASCMVHDGAVAQRCAAIGHALWNALERAESTLLEPADELFVLTRLGQILLREPDAAPGETVMHRLMLAVPRVDTSPERVRAGIVLLRYLSQRDRILAAEALVEALSPEAESRRIPPGVRLTWRAEVVRRLVTLHFHKEALEHIEALRQDADWRSLVHRNAVSQELRIEVLELEVLAWLGRGDLAQARQLLESWPAQNRQFGEAGEHQWSWLDATWYVHASQFATAAITAAKAWRRARDNDVPRFWRDALAECASAAQAGLRRLDRLAAWRKRLTPADAGTPHMPGHAQPDLDGALLQASVRISEGRDGAALPALRNTLGEHRVRHLASMLRHQPVAAALIADRALSAGIETTHVRSLVIRQRLQSPDPDNPHWPWPLAVHTFGAIELSRNGEIVTERGKAQQKPQTVFALLAAAGFAGIERRRLIAQVWPEGEPSGPLKALEINVHRLRKWLQCDAAVTLSNGILRIDDNHVWTDLRALERLAAQAPETLRDMTPSTAERRAAQLKVLYRGDYCAGVDCPALVVVRARYRRRYAQAAQLIGEVLENHGHWLSAEVLYGHALEIEPNAEALYRGLMRAADARHDLGRAADAYARCRTALSSALGMSPSAETLRLAMKLGLPADGTFGRTTMRTPS